MKASIILLSVMVYSDHPTQEDEHGFLASIDSVSESPASVARIYESLEQFVWYFAQF